MIEKLIVIITDERKSPYVPAFKSLGAETCTFDKSLLKLLAYTFSNKPTALVFDTIIDDFHLFLDKVSTFDNPPKIYVVSKDDTQIDFPSNLHAKTVMFNTYELTAFDIWFDISQNDNEKQISKMEQRSIAEKAIREALLELGMTSNYKGALYIKEIVLSICMGELNREDNLTNVIYPYVAERFNTNSSNVSRCIINAIQCSWEMTDDKVRTKYFGPFYASSTRIPTNGEFLLVFADFIALRVEDKIASS
ncbi:MAG: sporulation initiation factor Spo0A C-terminal domain-containing protein [Ruminococcus sp.]|nr:sporulation initiation factor Spo0A C-terminal domain-containing protein [Ruminococcus sp.]